MCEAVKERVLDIKTLILLIGGGAIAAVLAHGFYLSWRAGRNQLRMDIQPAPSQPFDEMELLKAELPTGKARIRRLPPEQGSLDLDGQAPLLMDSHQSPLTAGDVDSANDELASDGSTDRVADVTMPDEPIVADDRKPHGRQARADSRREAKKVQAREAASDSQRKRRPAVKQERQEEPAADADAELIIINVLNREGRKLSGSELVELFLAAGLKFGEMNIYHARDPLTRTIKYSVANAVEPGTFDLSSMDDFETPGVTFFMHLPGAEPALDAFDQMLRTAETVARRLNAELRDENQSVMTQQTIAHCRSRITEFYRKRMSKRAV